MSPRALAWAALGLSVVIWAAYLVVTRAAMTARLGPVEAGLIRFGTGAALFLPLILRRGLWPTGTTIRDILTIPIAGGVAFVLLLAAGLRFAPVADSGVFTPGMMPFYAAVLAAAILGERYSVIRLAGFGLILFGALVVGGWEALVSGTEGAWRGHLLFTGASIVWAISTIGVRLSALPPPLTAALMCGWSTLILFPLGLATGLDFSALSFGALAVQIVFAGVGSGFVAILTFFYSVRHLGASRTAACAALVPVLAALGGWVFLGEPIGALKTAGILIVAAGVALASGALGGRQSVGER